MSSNNNNTGSAIVLGCFGAIGLIVFAIAWAVILNAIALTVLWEWFIVPFFSVSALTIPYAIGFALIVSIVVKDSKIEDKESKGLAYVLGMAIMLPLLRVGFALLIGWIAVQFI